MANSTYFILYFRYLKYRHEQRDEMAEYAIAHGVTEAARHYGERTGTQIKASTIRNFVRYHLSELCQKRDIWYLHIMVFKRSYQQHPEELKLEVGRRAYQFGSDKCLAQMLQRGQGIGLNRTLVHRFMWVFLRRNPTLPVGPPDSGSKKKLRLLHK